MNKQELMQMVEHGISELGDALERGHSEQLVTYLSTMAKFHRYSLRNILLIGLQSPDATRVAGFQTWKRLGRQVLHGAKGIAILAPMINRVSKTEFCESLEPDSAKRVTKDYLHGFRVVHVFDVSQTSGRPLPEFASVHGEPGEQLDQLRTLIASQGIAMYYDKIGNGAIGAASPGLIVVKPGLSAAEEFSVLAHELAHHMLHIKELPRMVSETVRETEAEAVSFVLARAVGLDPTTRCSDYIKLYDGDKQVLARSMERIQNVAYQILSQLKIPD